MTPLNPRYVALDIHQNYFMAAAVNAEQETILAPHRVCLKSLESWAEKHLLPSDEVVIEATTNAWFVYDLLQPLVAEVVVAHPYHVKLIASSFVKTDKRDTVALARLLAAHIVPAIWVPPQHVRELRALIAHRQRLMHQRTAAKNRLRAVLHRNRLSAPDGDLFNQRNRDWWANLDMPHSERLRINHNLDTVDHLSKQMAEAERELALLSQSDPWRDAATRLIQLPGVGMLAAMTILSAVGEIERFATPKKLVGYAGLGAKVHASGKTHFGGGITKQGRTELRLIMVEIAWTAVTYSDLWRARFERLAQRIGRKKAIVAIARKMLVVVWQVLTKKEADQFANLKAVSRSFLTWATHHRLASSVGLGRAEFVQQALQRIPLSLPPPPT